VSLDLRSGDALIDLVREGFGAPLSQEDQALCTCCAVFSVHEPVPLTHSPVGLASGLMLLSTSGEGAAGTYPAFGATIHLASGLQALARRATTLCARSTRSLADPLPISSRSDRARFVVSVYSTRCSHWSASANASFAPMDRLRAA
jgi:class 3 adenylate cyclase